MPRTEGEAGAGSLQDFAELADALTWQRDRQAREALLADYCARTPDPDRGTAIGLLARHLDVPRLAAGRLRARLAAVLDEDLLRLVDAHVGEPLESLALLWPEPPEKDSPEKMPTPGLAESVEALQATTDIEARLPVITGLLDRLGPGGRRVLLDLLAGRRAAALSMAELRAGLCRHGGLEATALDELWPEQAPPYAALLAWLDGTAPPPARDAVGYRRPMPVTDLEDMEALADLPFEDVVVEWLWTGRRVQLVGDGQTLRLFDRDGEEISEKAPELIDTHPWIGIAEGVLQAVQQGEPAPPDILRRRLGRSRPTRDQRRNEPLRLMLFDLLADESGDRRPRPWTERRALLERQWPMFMGLPVALSPLLQAADADEVHEKLRNLPPGGEGLLLKRRAAGYDGTRSGNDWLACRPPPERLKAMLLYARRSNRHPGLFAEPAVGLRDGDGFATLGAGDWRLSAEQARLIDHWVREHTTRRYGPVRDVAPGLVLEIGFQRREPSRRHGAGWLLQTPTVLAVHAPATAEDADPVAHLDIADTGKT